MKILFTKGPSILSKAIRAATGEPVSHVALMFGRIVIHANLLGVHIEWAKNFLKHSEIVYALHRDPPEVFQETRDNDRLDKMLAQYEFTMYDFGALLFLGLNYLLHKTIRVPMAKSNLWQSKQTLMCTEWVTEYVNGEQNSVITPYQLYLKLKSNQEWVDA